MTPTNHTLRAADGGEKAVIAELLEGIRLATSEFVEGAEDKANAVAQVITACGLYAGVQFANLLLVGEADKRSTSRVAKLLDTNFRQGVKAGQAIAAQGDGGAAS